MLTRRHRPAKRQILRLMPLVVAFSKFPSEYRKIAINTQERRSAGPPAGVGGRRGVEAFLRPIGRRRTRSAANPGVAGRCAGPHERLGSHRRKS